jgi:hypothetical protein
MKSTKKLPPLSRRNLLGAPPAVALSSTGSIGSPKPAVASDPIAAVAERWIAIKRAEESLSRQWSEIEARLIENFRWAHLSEEEQQSLPEAKPLHAIDEQLHLLEQQRRECRAELVSLPTETLRHLLVKFRVVIDTISLADNDTAHHLLAVAIEELDGLTAAQVAS